MKQILLLVMLGSGLSVFSQSNVAQMSDDSSRSIELREIQVITKERTDRQRMLHFYRTNPSSTLEDILARLPELTLIRRGTYGMEPAIRSLSGGQINVLVDGMRIHGACTDKMDPATIYIEPLNLDQLQIQTGTQGFVNGSSTGGTVNLITAAPSCHTDKKLNGSITSGYQTAAKSIHEALQLNYSTGQWSFLGKVFH